MLIAKILASRKATKATPTADVTRIAKFNKTISDQKSTIKPAGANTYNAKLNIYAGKIKKKASQNYDELIVLSYIQIYK